MRARPDQRCSSSISSLQRAEELSATVVEAVADQSHRAEQARGPQPTAETNSSLNATRDPSARSSGLPPAAAVE